MKPNPEIERFWLTEIGPQRAVLTPIAVGLALFLAYTVAGSEWPRGVAAVAAVIFVLVCGVHGARLAAAAVSDEIANRTWDWQRLASVHPWTLTLGKLIGGTLFAWYAGALCLLALLVALPRAMSVDSSLLSIALVVVLALLLQGAGLLSGMVSVRRGQTAASGRIGLGMLLLLFLLGPVLLVGEVLIDSDADWTVDWFEQSYPPRPFLLLSGIACFGWFLAGSYHLMRAELCHRNTVWTWLGFVVFTSVFVAGFADETSIVSPITPALLAFAVALILTALAVLADPKDPVQWRAFLRALRRLRVWELQEVTPAWLVSYLFAVAMLVWMANSQPPSWAVFGEYFDVMRAATALLLFVARDVGLLLYLSLGPTRRGETSAVVLLLILYGLVPGLLAQIGHPGATVAFWPRGDVPWPAAVGPVLLQLVIVFALLRGRWAAQERRLGAPARPLES